MKVHLTRHRWRSHLVDLLALREAFRQTFEVTESGVVLLDFKCEVVHRGIVNGVVGFGARARYRTAQVQAGLSAAPLLDIEGAVGGCNIRDLTDHYGNAVFSTALAVVPGWHQFDIFMASYSSLFHVSGECAQISNAGPNPCGPFESYNTFRTVLLPGATLTDMTA